MTQKTNIDITASLTAVSSNPFALASQHKYRFQIAGRGVLSVEDLWALKPKELSDAYQAMDAAVKKSDAGRSLLEEDKTDPEIANKMEIIRIIFDYKMAALKMASDENDNRQYMQRVAAALQAKRNKSLEEMSESELEAILRNGGPLPKDPTPAE